MNSLPINLSDILKSLMQALRVSSVFPATVFVLTNCLLILPERVVLDLSVPSTAVLIVTSILALSYLLYAFNAPLIRLIEGYPFRLEWLGRCLSKCQKNQYRHYCDELVLSQKKINEILIHQARLVHKHNLIKPEDKARHEGYRRLERWKREWQVRRNSARQILYYHYPYPKGSEADILPTLLGNTIASFERYAYDRYGVDAVVMWPRLVPVLQKEGFVPFVEGEKTVFDFLLNLSFLTFLLAVEACWFFAPGSPVKGILLLFILGVVAYLLYRAAVIGAVNWGATIEAAFDLYRGHLRKALGMREPISLDQEQKDWQKLSKFYADGVPFGHFVYEGKAESASDQKQEQSGGKKRWSCHQLWGWLRSRSK